MSYSAGIIGTGGIAGMGILGMHDEEQIGNERVRASHAGGYGETEDVDLVAVADVDEEKLATFGEAWDIGDGRQYVGHEAMLEAEDLDVVSVCTPSFLHHDHVIDAARIGDPDVIWCEKPIASSVADAEEMVEVCEAEGVELLINHSFRFTEKLRRLKELVREEDLIGDIRSAAVQYRMELLRNSTHVLDTLLYMTDAEVEHLSGYVNGQNEAVDSLQADKRVDDAAGGGHVVMDDGSFFTVDCTIPRAESSMTFNVIGTEGKLYLNNDDGEPWRYWELEDGEHVERELPGIEGAWTWDEDYRRAFPNAAEHVVELLDGEAENRSTGREATKSLAIIIGFYISEYTGSRVEFPLDPPLRDVTITSW